MFVLSITGSVQVLYWGEMEYADRTLLARAIRVRKNASTPVSGYMVGAALRPVGSDRVFYGCNVEEDGQTSTVHAEAAALSAMISALGPQARCSTIAIALGPRDESVTSPPKHTGRLITSLSEITRTPCGHCRGLFSQYGGGDIRFLCLQQNGQVVIGTMADFFPCGFKL